VVRVGFVVEGVSDKKLIESGSFKNWAKHPTCASARYFVDKLCALSHG